MNGFDEKWVTWFVDDFSGGSLEIILPSKVNFVKPRIPSWCNVHLENGREITYVREDHIVNTLKDAIKICLEGIMVSFEKMDGDHFAANDEKELYHEKCEIALEELKRLYLVDFPELFF